MSKTNSIRQPSPSRDRMFLTTEKQRASLNVKPSLLKARKTIELAGTATAIMLEAALQAGVRPSALSKFQKAIEVLDGLTDLTLPGLNGQKEFAEALAKRPN